MKVFRTELSVKPSGHIIGSDTPVLTIGSCFSDSIGKLLHEYKFDAAVNPFGTIFNPLSVHKLLTYAIEPKQPEENTYLHHQGIWNNYDFHSSFSGLTKEDTQAKVNEKIEITHSFLKRAIYLVITYGTAWVYDRNDTSEFVANCHKVPSANFTKRLVTPEEIGQSFDQFYAMLQSRYPNIKIILTVSPVRHIKDTLEGNSISKAILKTAVHGIVQKYSLLYFPSYEIMMDDLRDYRFYESDMLHPSAEAIEYIWEKFSEAYFTSGTKEFINQWKSIRMALHHKPFQPQSISHQQFLRDTISKLKALTLSINVEQEIKEIEAQLV